VGTSALTVRTEAEELQEQTVEPDQSGLGHMGQWDRRQDLPGVQERAGQREAQLAAVARRAADING
jgi:hypothetical protein